MYSGFHFFFKLNRLETQHTGTRGLWVRPFPVIPTAHGHLRITVVRPQTSVTRDGGHAARVVSGHDNRPARHRHVGALGD